MHRAPQSVVVVGGGIAGASISRVLASAGVRVTLLEKAGQLCSGATWHAAGLVTRFGGSSKLKKVHVRALALLTDLHDRFGIGLHVPGSIRIIEKGNRERLQEAKQHVSMAALFDDPVYPTSLISAEEVAALHPLIDISSVECGVYTPHDGDVDPTSLTNCVAQLARDDGAVVRFNAEVCRVEPGAGGSGFRVHVRGDAAPIDCDAVVNAAGLWSRRLSDMAPAPAGSGHMNHPAFVIEHQYAITETVPAVRELAARGHNGGRLPVLRDLAGSSYIRQEGNGFLIGPYEAECVVRTDMPRGPPADFIMELFPDRLGRIEENLLMGMALLPCLGEVGFKTVVNGPTIWTGDSLARVGRTQVPGWYDFNSLTYGIAQSLAIAEYLGHIILHGEQPAGFDASDTFDPLRYGAWAGDAYTEAKIKETYTHNNRVNFGAYENRSAGRQHVRAPYPLHDVLAAHGARFAAFGGAGCEVPLCFVAAAEPDPAASAAVVGGGGGSGGGAVAAPALAHAPQSEAEVDFHDAKQFAQFAWAPLAEDEARHVLQKVGLAYSSFSKLRVSGADAKAFISEVTTAVLPSSDPADAPGDMPCRLTYATTPRGQVQTEFTLCRVADDGSEWYLVGSRDHARQDAAWLRQCRGTRAVDISDATDDVCVLHLCGPRAGALLLALEPRAAGLPFMRARALRDFGGAQGLSVQVFRVSFTGEAGFELHVPATLGPQLHALVWESDAARAQELRHVGSAAINSLRIEKGFKLRADLDFAHYKEAGIAPFVAKKRAFLGKDDVGAHVPARAAAMFFVDTPPGWEWSVVGDSPVRRASDDAVVGYTTTSCRGASTGRTVAMGFTLASAFRPEEDGKEGCLVLDTFGERWPASYLAAPPLAVNRDVFR